MLLSDCHYPEWILKWIDLCQYTIPQLIASGLGEVLWTVVYILVIRDALKKKYVQLPATIVAANLAWEFLAGFVFPSPAGKLMGLGFQIWFAIDVVIFALVMKYGRKQLPSDEQVKYFPYIIISISVMTLILLYLYFIEGSIIEHYSIAAYLINLIMSAQFLMNIMRLSVVKFMSRKVAWAKMLGTGITTVAVLLSKDPQLVVIGMGIFVFAADVLYIIALHKAKKAGLDKASY